MFGRRHIGLQLAAVLLPGLLYITSAGAMDNHPVTTGSAATGEFDRSSTEAEAPVGHRQPTEADVANARSTASDREREKLDRRLDRRLQICRGC
jgi:hypothetical protein